MLSGSSNDLDKQLFNAVKVDDANNVERLITLGANVNATTNDGVTPLHVAAINDNTQVVNALLLIFVRALNQIRNVYIILS